MYVYKLTNIIDGKSYIGQTTRTVEERVLEHFKYHLKPDRGCRKLSFAIKKYGVENFKIETIDTADSLEDLNNKEIYWIEYYNSMKNGYNLSSGGNGRGSFISDETRKLLSKAGKGRKHSADQKRKIREAHLIPVYQYTKDGFFIKEHSSSADAFLITNINNSDIGKCCKGKKKSAGGYQWKFFKNKKIDAVLPRKKSIPKNKPITNNKRVAKINSDRIILEIYNSIIEAAAKNKCDNSDIVKVCKGKMKSVKGLLFIYHSILQ